MTTIVDESTTDISVLTPPDDFCLEADWSIPDKPRGVVLFASCGNGSRFDPGSRVIARRLFDAGFATAVVDLLTPDEEIEDALTGAVRLDMTLLADRITKAAEWTRGDPKLSGLPIGCIASGVASAGALVAASRNRELFVAIVSNYGRPDLAGVRLHKVRTPTLLLIGDSDMRCKELNRWALRRLDCEKQLETLAGTSHHFEEAEALDRAANIAASWFRRFMPVTRMKSIFSVNWTDRRANSFSFGKPGLALPVTVSARRSAKAPAVRT